MIWPFNKLLAADTAHLARPPAATWETLSYQQQYAWLRNYYLCNGLYQGLQAQSHQLGLWTEGMHPLRNPAYRVVEFYTGKLWPGTLPDALPIVADNTAIVEPIQQVWTWSNWGARKQVAARWFALYGDLFIKVAQTEKKDRVYLQLLEPIYVTDFDADERGYLTYARIDVPVMKRENNKAKTVTHTEVWTKDDLRVWEHSLGENTDLERLGEPARISPLSEFGIDFVPIVHAPFRDIGEARGMASFTHALDKIDEANRMATRLHQMLFRYNKPLWAVSANMVDPSGRPLPGPRVAGAEGTEESDTFEMGDDRMVRLPGNSSMEALVPTLDYASALTILQDHMGELERDLPELAYYRLREKGDLSGRAVRLLLGDAVDRALEARGNAEAALARADMMALTIGVQAGLFKGIGTYEGGGFEHTFEERDIVPLSEYEKGQNDLVEVQIAQGKQQMGVPDAVLWDELGYNDEQIAQMVEDKAAEQVAQKDTLAQTLLRMQRQADQGQGGNGAQPPPPAGGAMMQPGAQPVVGGNDNPAERGNNAQQ